MDFHNYLFRHTVQNFLAVQYQKMDSLKIHDSQLSNRDNKSFFRFLDKKAKTKSADNVSVYSVDLQTSEDKPERIRPNYSFVFESFTIGEHVEYDVVLVEKYKILGRIVSNKYRFKTRYSMLEVLDSKLRGSEFPSKKFFGNKNPTFLEKRKIELQSYLNRVARGGSAEFYKFVKQIKDCDFNLSLNKSFKLD